MMSRSALSFSTWNWATRIDPLSIGIRPLMQRSIVDLPAPDGPMMQATSPLAISNDTPFSTLTAPNDLWTSLTLTIGCSGIHRSSRTLQGASEVDRILAFQVDGPARDRIAVEEEPHQDVEIEWHQQVGAVLGGEYVARQRHDLRDADDRDQHGADGEDRIQVHPRRQHPLDALRKDDHPQCLATRERERRGRFPLSGGNRLDGAADDLRHVRHHRQREAECRLDPVRQ